MNTQHEQFETLGEILKPEQPVKPTYKVISRTTALTEFEGSYSECMAYFNKVGFDLSIFKIDQPLYDEDGQFNPICSN